MHFRQPLPAHVLLTCLLLAGGCGDALVEGPGSPGTPSFDPNRTVGVIYSAPGSQPGYTLFAPMSSTTTYLIDVAGRVVNTWSSAYRPGNSVYLLEDGSLLRAANDGPHARFTAGGAAGRVQRFTWDGTLVWDFVFSGADFHHHHDVAPMPNGNVLVLAWENKTMAEAVQAGRDPSFLADGEVWPDMVAEIEPVGATGGNVVWEWRAWDHLVQDFDATKDNFGVVADHPELIDVNFGLNANDDWMHTNAIDYNPALDQILLGVHHMSEIWVIDHATTTAEAAGHTGGAQGKGGDILYRWGNPQAYDHGTAADQQLWVQHDPHWIGPGPSNILVFNNGTGRPGGPFSSVDEIVPPADASGAYARTPGAAFGPAAPLASFTAPNPTDLYAGFISGAQRLPNGNTLVCDGPQGRFFEITAGGTVVWDYVNPDIGTGVLAFDDPIPVGPGGRRNTVFRATRIPTTHPALAGRDLTPGATIEN